MAEEKEATAEEVLEAVKANIKFHGNAAALQRCEGRTQEAWKHDQIRAELQRVLNGEKLRFRV